MVIYRHLLSFSVFQSVSGRHHTIFEVSGCFRTARPVFQDGLLVVQEGSRRLSQNVSEWQSTFSTCTIFQSTFSLLPIGILSGSSVWFQDVSVVLVAVVSVVSVVSDVSLFQVSAVQDQNFSLPG